MPYVSFHDYFPAVAEHETRSVTVFPGSDANLPPDDYGFTEMFCDERGCDCRRVFFMVLSRSRSRPVAVIAWGWEDLAFYARWMRDDDPRILHTLKGPYLNDASPQSELAPALLELARDVLLNDPDYVERVKSHYAMFRERVEGPGKKRRLRKLKRR